MDTITPNIDISKLTEADRKDLSQKLANESQKMNMQQSTYSFPPFLKSPLVHEFALIDIL